MVMEKGQTWVEGQCVGQEISQGIHGRNQVIRLFSLEKSINVYYRKIASLISKVKL